MPDCNRASPVVRFRSLALMLGLAAVVACSQSHSPRPTAEVAGSITYRERVALPADARVEIQLLDVTDESEATPPLIAERLLDAPGQIPIAFTLGYDPGAIDATHTYSLRVRIRVDGELWFASPFDLRVLTGGNPDRVEVLLDRVSGGIDARLDRYDMREIPITDLRLLQLWFDDDRPIKLVVSDTGRVTRTSSYYFRDGALFWVRDPSAGYAFENDTLVLRTDAKLSPLADTSGGSGVLRDVRGYLDEFGL